MAISSDGFGTLNKAISAYTDESYTRAKKLVSTAIMGTNASINANGEDFIGQVRFYKPLGAYTSTSNATESESIAGGIEGDALVTAVNVASQNENYGATTNISTDVQTYIKTVRTHGANEYLVQEVISKQDGLAKIARDFSETRAEDEDQSVRSIIAGVRGAELGIAADASLFDADTSNYQDFWAGNAVDADPSKGFGYVAVKSLISSKIGTGDNIDTLVDNTTAGLAPGLRVRHLIKAMGAWADYVPSFVYLVVGPETYLDIKVANIVDDERVTDGNIAFETILSGQVRLVVSRSYSTSLKVTNISIAGNTEATGIKTSYMMLPGSMYMADVSVPNPVAIDRNESVGSGSGRTTAWYRWGYVMHPRGYTFVGNDSVFASNGTFAAAASWNRKSDILNLGILPIFHR